MEGNLFYGQSAHFLLVVNTIILMAAAVLGFLLGRFSSRRIIDKSPIGGIQASVFGLLALMLGFTFSAAFSRYDSRRVLVIDEANALGTTFLRAQTLPEPYRTQLSHRLRQYINFRSQIGTVIDNPTELNKMMKKTQTLQQEMWGEASSAARRLPTPVTALFLASLNQSIDLYSTRVAMFRARVPNTILWILAAISIAALVVVGYGFGIVGQQSWFIIILVSFLVSAVIVMIVDLDRPETGPVRISQQSMLDLRNSLTGFEEKSR
ncbi:MAG: hypothetical protein NT018_14695 [Armatimonadetes bacterium]|nr:hypothetical protein [Armatimonadota bacterium]